MSRALCIFTPSEGPATDGLQTYFSRQISPEAEMERRRRKRRCIFIWISGILAVILLIVLDYVIMLRQQQQLQNRPPKVGRRLVKVRLFWIRHGLSCANVMDKCSKGPGQSKQLLPKVEHALRLVPGYETAKLNHSFGLKAATATEGDCTVAVEAPNLTPGQVGKKGAIIRVHDLYTDPLLTDCSRRQSIQAGRSFIKWLRKKRIKVHFAGSSFLMRALQTAYGMLRAPCGETEGLDCDAVFRRRSSVLAPIPYMTERAPPGITSFQQDNIPRSFEEQQQMIDKVYNKTLEVNSSFAWSWPRYAQHYEKFKAFLAVIIVPSVSKVVSWKVPPTDVFRTSLETDLPETMHPEDRGKATVTVQWPGGEYVTGKDFNKSEYKSLKAPELNFVIVGHNQMMSEYCLAPDYLPKPNNNAILEKLFILELPDKAVGFQRIKMRELGGKCALVMDAPSKEESFSDLATADVTNCSSPFRVADFLKLKDGIDIRDTRCVQVAPESAFPIQPDFL